MLLHSLLKLRDLDIIRSEIMKFLVDSSTVEGGAWGFNFVNLWEVTSETIYKVCSETFDEMNTAMLMWLAW